MSKIAVSLPKGMAKSSVIGGGAALGVYILLQMVWAWLIHRQMVGEETLYPLVCLSAALASFLGCLISVLGRKDASVLGVSAVVAVFLALTLSAAFMTAEVIAVDNGLTGVGLSMAAGGLLAALVGPVLVAGKGKDARRRKAARRRA